MSIMGAPIGETEQAAEKGTAFFFRCLKEYTDYLFEKLWQTRVVVDVGRREMPK